MTFTPTAQQNTILASAAQGNNLIVTARAGCGKTSTLSLLANALPGYGLAIAFNKRIATELAERMPDTYECKTLNSLGLAAWRAGRNRINTDGRKNYKLIDEYCETKRITVTWDEKSILAKLLDFCKTSGLVPQGSPYTGAGLIPDDPESWDAAWEWIEEEPNPDQTLLAKALLKESIAKSFAGWIDFNDQIYMPTCFGGKWPSVDVLMVDECQDLSALNHKMIRLIRAKQVILVGDPKQAIYGFRGAMTDSMVHLEKAITNKAPIVHLPLTVTFRCGREIVARAQALVPDYLYADTNPQGEVLTWEKWTPAQVPDGAAILCRNNAPLVSCALKFLRAKRNVTILGREFAERLKKDILKAVGNNQALDIATALTRIREFYNKKLAANPTASQVELVNDRVAALEALTEDGDCPDVNSLLRTLDSIFSETKAPVTLSTGHKAKGLEWDFVVHLNPKLIPARWAKDPESIEQEYNLRYVIETRPKHTLVLADLETLEV